MEKIIKNTENRYTINEIGLVYDTKLKKYITIYDNGRGYKNVDICLNGKRQKSYIHRLVAEAFLPNPENKKTVNHINGIKSDNRLENLEWMTQSENIKHSFDILKRQTPKGTTNLKNKGTGNGNHSLCYNTQNGFISSYSEVSSSSAFKASMSGQNKNQTIYEPVYPSAKYLETNNGIKKYRTTQRFCIDNYGNILSYPEAAKEIKVCYNKFHKMMNNTNKNHTQYATI
jgi:hypothetical protein